MLHIADHADGAPKRDMDLAPEFGQASRKAPALAVNPHGELLVLDAPGIARPALPHQLLTLPRTRYHCGLECFTR